MEDLVRSYNPNYQDMAVRAAAMGYMEVYHGGATPPAEGGGAGGKQEEMAGGQQPVKEEEKKEEEVEDKEEEVTDKELEELERLDLMGLLVGWDDESERSSGQDDGDSIRKSFKLSQSSTTRCVSLDIALLKILLRFLRTLARMGSLQYRRVHSRHPHRFVRVPPNRCCILAREVRRPRQVYQDCLEDSLQLRCLVGRFVFLPRLTGLSFHPPFLS
jgi:hypothetical protein